MSEPKEAAERLRRLLGYGGNLYPQAVYCSDGRCEATAMLRMGSDEYTLAAAYLAEHKPDDELPIDNDFLRSIGFGQVEGAPTMVYSLGTLETWPEYIDREGNRRWSINRGDWDTMVPSPLCPKNRGDVRRLCKQLGIEISP